MSHFLKIFRSKRPVGQDKENEPPSDEERDGGRQRQNSLSQGSARREKRSARLRAVDDTMLKPSAPYHTVTQPKQNKGSRSCVGRDEYDRYRLSFDGIRERSMSKHAKRLYCVSELRDMSSSNNTNTYDAELLDSDDSFSSERGDRRSRIFKSDETIKALEAKIDSLMYRFRREEEKKNGYKQKLISERIVRQHVETKFVAEIQHLRELVNTLKNENKAYRNKIALLEADLQSGGLSSHVSLSKPASSLFCSPPSTSNGGNSSLGGAGETLCNASASTLPVDNKCHCNSFNDEDEVKNYRVDSLSSEIARCIDGSSSGGIDGGDSDGDLDSTVLNDTAHGSRHTLCAQNLKLLAGKKKSCFRRSMSDSDIKCSDKVRDAPKRNETILKMTNL